MCVILSEVRTLSELTKGRHLILSIGVALLNMIPVLTCLTHIDTLYSPFQSLVVSINSYNLFTTIRRLALSEVWSGVPCCFIDSLLKSFEIILEKLSHFLQILIVLILVSPVVSRIKDLRVDTVDLCGNIQVKDRHLRVFSLFESAVMNGVDDFTGIHNANSLHVKLSLTLPTPYRPPIQPVFKSQTCEPCFLIFSASSVA